MMGHGLSALSGTWKAASGSITNEVSAKKMKATMKSQSQLSARDMAQVSRSGGNEARRVAGGEARRIGYGAAAQERIGARHQRRALVVVAEDAEPATGVGQLHLDAGRLE